MELGQDILSQHKAHVAQRLTIERFWRDAFELTIPHRGQQFLRGGADGYANATQAQRDLSVIFDSTAIDAVRLLSSSIISGLTPSNSQWFKMGVEADNVDEIPHDGVKWLQNASGTLFKQIHTSNYNAAAFEFFQDIAVCGMDGLFIDKEHGGDFMFEVWSLGTMYVSESKTTGLIDTVYRTVELSIGEAIDQFGLENLPDKLKDVAKNSPHSLTKYPFIHCIRPRIKKGKQTQGKLSTQLPFESVYACAETGKVVKESGFYEFPVVIPRWSVIPGTAYAVGPINDCLPDIKTINKVREMMLTNAEMAISGTFVAKHDGILNPNTIKIGPRRVIFAADSRNIQPLSTGGNFQIAFEVIADLQRQIKSVMMADELSPMQKNYASATEVTVRAQIIRQILGPVYARLQSEFLQPLLERCFGLAFRDGSLGQPPESIEGMNVIPEYQSPMARAQKMEQVSAMDQFEQSLANFAQMDQGVMDLYDADAAYRKRAELLAVPIDVINSKDEVRSKREQQAKAQQLQMEQEQQQAMQMEGQPA